MSVREADVSPATRRALRVLVDGPRDAKGFAEALWPAMGHGRATRVGSRGGYAAGQQGARVAGSVLARLVRAGLASVAWVGSGPASRRRWTITPAGRAAACACSWRLLDARGDGPGLPGPVTVRALEEGGAPYYAAYASVFSWRGTSRASPEEAARDCIRQAAAHLGPLALTFEGCADERFGPPGAPT